MIAINPQFLSTKSHLYVMPCVEEVYHIAVVTCWNIQ